MRVKLAVILVSTNFCCCKILICYFNDGFFLSISPGDSKYSEVTRNTLKMMTNNNPRRGRLNKNALNSYRTYICLLIELTIC